MADHDWIEEQIEKMEGCGSRLPPAVLHTVKAALRGNLAKEPLTGAEITRLASDLLSGMTERDSQDEN